MNKNIFPEIETSWKKALNEEFQQDYFEDLVAFLKEEKDKDIRFFPREEEIFNAFNHTPFNEVKVVIIGQDPYHSFEHLNGTEHAHAHGLSFSVPKESKKIPPSLKNIYKELNSDLGCTIPAHGNLMQWAKQGVLLLNATLTVRAHQPGSHQKKGWEEFTDAAIQAISSKREGVIFLLWGRFAQNKKELIDQNRHHVLEAAHPSPFSARNGFFGCKHFSLCNEKLKQMGLQEIMWCIQ